MEIDSIGSICRTHVSAMKPASLGEMACRAQQRLQPAFERRLIFETIVKAGVKRRYNNLFERAALDIQIKAQGERKIVHIPRSTQALVISSSLSRLVSLAIRSREEESLAQGPI